MAGEMAPVLSGLPLPWTHFVLNFIVLSPYISDKICFYLQTTIVDNIIPLFN